jgi:predicted small integral membrane protein
MWQSTAWNGQAAAFRISMAILGTMILVGLPDSD